MQLTQTAMDALSPRTPAATRLMAARGLLPLSPAEQIFVLFRMALEDEEQIRDTAMESLESFPRRLMVAAAEHVDDPELIRFLCQKFHQDAEIIEKLLLRPEITNETLVFIAEFTEDPTLLRIVAERRERVEAHPQIYRALKRNPLTPPWILLQIQEQIPSLREITEPAPKPLDTAPELPEQSVPHAGPPSLSDAFPDCLISPSASESDLPAIRTLIKEMDPERRKILARTGNVHVRYLLIQDPTQDVAVEVLDHPDLAMEEIVQYCTLRNVPQEILRRIGIQTEWSKEARVRNQLVKNPKTPHFLVLRFLETIGSLSEIERLARSREVSGAVSHAARVILEKRAFRIGAGPAARRPTGPPGRGGTRSSSN